MSLAYVPADGGPRSLRWPLLLDFPNSDGDGDGAPGPTGVRAPDDFLLQPLRVVAIDFESDHRKKMTDKGYGDDESAGDFAPGGKPFTQDWTYIFNSDRLEEKSFPVSHAGGRKVALLVAVKNDYAEPVEATLTGTVLKSNVADGMQFVRVDHTFEPGISLLRVISDTELRKTIRMEKFKVEWRLTGPRISSILNSPRFFFAPPITTTNELFVTLGEPKLEGDEITYERMAHAVNKAGAASDADPHKIVEKLVHGLKDNFSGELNTNDAWFFARNPSGKADCISIARYVAAILQMVGISGKAEAVIVYVRPKRAIEWTALVPEDKTRTYKGFPAPNSVEQVRLVRKPIAGDFEVVEGPAPASPGARAGLNRPVIVHPRELWRLSLLDEFDVFNNYEGCVKFTPAHGDTKWYPAGTRYPGVSKASDVIPTVFKSLSWIDNDDKPRETVEKYR